MKTKAQAKEADIPRTFWGILPQTGDFARATEQPWVISLFPYTVEGKDRKAACQTLVPRVSPRHMPAAATQHALCELYLWASAPKDQRSSSLYFTARPNLPHGWPRLSKVDGYFSELYGPICHWLISRE